jgi:hypothetical protein
MLVLEAADDKIQRLAHGGEVSRDVDCVRNNQKAHRNQHEWQGIELLGIGRDALACDPPDMRADELDRDHERRREKHRPQ